MTTQSKVKKAHPTENDDEINKRATNRYEAMIFLMRSDKSKYTHLWNELQTNTSQGGDRYPHDISSARNILYNYSMPNNNNNINDTQIILSQVNFDDSENRGNNTPIPGIDSK